MQFSVELMLEVVFSGKDGRPRLSRGAHMDGEDLDRDEIEYEELTLLNS